MALMPYLTDDMFSNIFMRLPAYDVHSLRYQCKLWKDVISSSSFINAHSLHSKHGFLAVRSVQGTNFNETDFIVIENGETTICSSNVRCRNILHTLDGFVLLEDVPKKGDISVGNLVTKQCTKLPPYTRRIDNDYLGRGLVFIESTKEYKVVFVVRGDHGPDDSSNSKGCAILTLSSMDWDWVETTDDPTTWKADFGFKSIGGVLYWLGSEEDEEDSMDEDDAQISEYLISFDAREKRFSTKDLPNDPRLFPLLGQFYEVQGCLAIVGVGPATDNDQMRIWILEGENWVMRTKVINQRLIDIFSHRWSLTHVMAFLDDCTSMVVLHSDDEGTKLYIYNFQLQRGKTWKINTKYTSMLPHVASLTSF